MDYNKTINLPKTEFPMRAGLPAREPAMLEGWEKMDLLCRAATFLWQNFRESHSTPLGSTGHKP